MNPLETLRKELKIGPVVTSPALLAPMSGVTNAAFRRLIRRKNPTSLGLVVTEFISIEGLTRSNPRSVNMMRFHEEERPISIQIFGYDIERMVDAAKMAEEAGADIVDINSGCPVPKVVRRGGGCELMRQPEHMAKMLESVAKAIKVPLTLKIRSGWDDSSRNAVEIAKIAENSGVQMLTVHGRTRVQLYRDFADYDIVRQVAESVSIPVIGSGDVLDSASAAERMKSGIAGLMIGRGALANPWIFNEIMTDLEGASNNPLPDTSVPDVLVEYLQLNREDLPERAIMGKMKQFASQVTRRIGGSTDVRRDLCRSQSIEEFLEILARWREQLALNEGSQFSEAIAA